MDENYLNLVRDDLYSRKNEPSKNSSSKFHNFNRNKQKPSVSEDSNKSESTATLKTKKTKPDGNIYVEKKLDDIKVRFGDIGSIKKNTEGQESDNNSSCKQRVATPFKIKKKPLKDEKNDKGVFKSPKSLFPTKIKVSQDKPVDLSKVEFNPDQKSKEIKKRILSSSDSSVISLQTKKNKHFEKKRQKLVFDNEALDSSPQEISNPELAIFKNKSETATTISKKKKAKNKFLNFKEPTAIVSLDHKTTSSNPSGKSPKKVTNNVRVVTSPKNKKSDNIFQNETVTLDYLKTSHKMDICETNDDFYGESSMSESAVKPKNPNRTRSRKKPNKTITGDPINVLDFEDDKINVQGMKFGKFSSLFTPVFNEQYLGQNAELNIPKKHFKITNGDMEPQGLADLNKNKPKGANRLKINKKNKIKVGDTQGINAGATDKIIIDGGDGLNYPINSFNETDGAGIDQTYNMLNVRRGSSKKGNNNKHRRAKQVNQTEQIQMEIEETVSVFDSFHINSSTPTKTEDIKNNKGEELQLLDHSQTYFITLKDKTKILVLLPGAVAYLYGLCSVEVINGSVEIFGTEISKTSGTKLVYSPRGSALLSAKNTSHFFSNEVFEFTSFVSSSLIPEAWLDVSFEKNCAMILFKELNEHHLEFVEKHISQIIFPEKRDLGPRIEVNPSGTWNKIKTSGNWAQILDTTPEMSKTVVMGGKGVGKSTFVRYSVNRLLRRFSKIRVVDLDPGQSEIAPPGCISVATVEKEFLGPNYTHLQKPDRMILCHINIGFDAGKYLQSVKELINFTNTLEPLPTLINFHGFTQGLGFDISLHALYIIQPTCVIQIQSKTVNKNFKIDMTPQNVTKRAFHSSISRMKPSNLKCRLDYKFVKLESEAESNGAWALESRQAREMNLIAYMGRMMSENVKFLTSPEVNMYCINYSTLTITNLEGERLSPLAINANLVSLCSRTESHENIFVTYGYGFVRGLDTQSETVVLLTPESIETLKKVDCLVSGSVSMPPSLIMTTEDVIGHIPYLSANELVDFGQMTKRSYVPARK